MVDCDNVGTGIFLKMGVLTDAYGKGGWVGHNF